MKLLPFEDFYIISHLKPDEVQQQLQQVVEPPPALKDWFDGPPTSYFKGWGNNGTFEIRRVINYRNQFLPVIKGSTETYINGSRVHVKIRMTKFITIFMSVWLFWAALGGFAVVMQQMEKAPFKTNMLLPFGMFFFGYAIVKGSFIFESRKATDKLCEVLEGVVERK